MRPDEHKAKESRRYQQRKKKQGDSTAAEIAEERKRRARANDKGTSIAAIRRRNGELPSTTTQTTFTSIKTGQFSKRKIINNQDRYKERSLQDDIDQDAELGIDRETTDLVTMLEDAEGHLSGGSTYFKFKEEQELSSTYKDESLLQVNFDALEKKFQQTETRILLGLSKDDMDVIECAFEQDFIGLQKPLIPAMNKTSQGVILLKSSSLEQQQQSKNDGIYIRNDRSNQRITPKQDERSESNVKLKEDEKELDVLLGFESTNNVIQDTTKSTTATSTKLVKPSMPKLKVPGSALPKSVIKNDKSTDDQAWLDDLLG
ncbi:uncharacterized protein BX664DRAFT_44972 [Halteromyces radiatus]|uniref:uncharacterized protein n=1 Tax=Halteromyces radiatus TaxID=101107 RepID=UPI0022209980|nr:uncharacterized protein BX664DRAFT_44972 [Halteromyces radiatus]KAI8077847.1 hypothetical protein BX664DRAFT_44972 [Halteromyces radiatus]